MSTAPGTVPRGRSPISVRRVLVSVSTRRLRSSSGAIVLKIVARRSEAWPSMASAVASSCATLTSSNAALTPVHDPQPVVRVFRRVQQLHDDVRLELGRRGREIPHHLGNALRRRRRHDAGEVTEGRQHGRRLRGDHRRPVRRALGRADGGRQVGDVGGVLGDGEEARLGLLRRRRRLWPLTIEATIDCHRSSRLAPSPPVPCSRSSSFW